VINLVSVALGMVLFAAALVLFFLVYRLAAVRRLRGWWIFLAALICFFLAGYTLFLAFLVRGEVPSFEIETMISQIFLWGSVFVVVCAGLFLATLRERKAIDERLQHFAERSSHTQKLEAVGRLAGNVAHEFNNVLTTIIGSSELGSVGLDPSEPQAREFQEIHTAALRAERLTGQLLAFSRRRSFQMEVLSLEEMLGDMGTILERVLHPGVSLEVVAETPGWVSGDRDQLELLVVNLVRNSNDAMPEGGHIRVRLRSVESPVVERIVPDLGEGRGASFIELAVIDNGPGIASHLRSRIFEPYFTTKSVGAGTGLGLSIAYGVARRHGGVLDIDPRHEGGACFLAYVPEAEPVAAEAAESEVAQEAVLLQGSAEESTRILVVDDDPQVADLARRSLVRAGYEVSVASGSEGALQRMEEVGASMDLILCDVILPGLRGPELIARIRGCFPDVRVIYMTGFPGEEEDLSVQLSREDKVLMKPFAPARLLELVAEESARAGPGSERSRTEGDSSG